MISPSGYIYVKEYNIFVFKQWNWKNFVQCYWGFIKTAYFEWIKHSYIIYSTSIIASVPHFLFVKKKEKEKRISKCFLKCCCDISSVIKINFILGTLSIRIYCYIKLKLNNLQVSLVPLMHCRMDDNVVSSPFQGFSTCQLTSNWTKSVF